MTTQELLKTLSESVPAMYTACRMRNGKRILCCFPFDDYIYRHGKIIIGIDSTGEEVSIKTSKIKRIEQDSENPDIIEIFYHGGKKESLFLLGYYDNLYAP